MRAWRFIGLALAALLSTGCATSYLLEAQVGSFSRPPVPTAPFTYRHERLPSQAADAERAELEALADAALARAGLRRDDAAARYSLQLQARSQRVVSPYTDPRDPWFGWAWAWPGRGWAWSLHRPFPRTEPDWYDRQVHLVLRDLASGQVVYETQAASDGPFFGQKAVFAALLEAALKDFPAPPEGARRVEVPIPR